MFSHRIVKLGSSPCQGLRSLCVSGLFISDYIPPEHLQDQFIKPAFMGFGKGFMGTAGYGGQSLYLQIKHILLPRRPLKTGAGCNSSSTPRGIQKQSATSPPLFGKPGSCGAVAFLDRFSFRTLSGLEERSCGHRVDCDRGVPGHQGRVACSSASHTDLPQDNRKHGAWVACCKILGDRLLLPCIKMAS